MNELSDFVRDLKARLSGYLRKVKQGQTIIITEPGNPIGRILPIEQSLDEKIEALREAGLVAWNGREPKPLMPAAVNRSQKQVSDILVEMRSWVG